MSYVWAPWLADALRGQGCRVSEYSGWTSRGRPASTGHFAPYGVLWHHTGTTSSDANPCPTLSVCVNGRSDLPGPLCHVVIGYDGVCHVIAAGRANHAGKNRGSGPIPAGDGNAQMFGFEIDYNGTQAMSTVQYQAALAAAIGVLDHIKRDESYARGHKETATDGKWDPGGYDMNTMRSQVAAQMGGDMPLTDADVAKIWSYALSQNIEGQPPTTTTGTVLTRINPGPGGFAGSVAAAVWQRLTTSAVDGSKQTYETILRWAQGDANKAANK